MTWSLRPKQLFQIMPGSRTDDTRGAAAVEFALVFPLFVVVMCGVFAFSFAMLGRQLLSNVASETSRACALRTEGGVEAVSSCVNTVGPYLINTMPGMCFGGHITMTSKTVALGQQGLSATTKYPIQEWLLVVTARCQIPFTLTDSGFLQGASTVTPSALQAVSTMPFTISSNT